MDKTVFGLFNDREDVESLIDRLKDDGYSPKDISLVMKDSREAREIEENTGTDVASGAVSGATTGAILGGLAGLLGAFVLPGIGALFIGGPIAAALGLTGAAATTASGAVTGAAAGGLIGALGGLGLSQNDAKTYETGIRQGAILVAVPVRGEEENDVESLFNEYDAENVKSVSMERRSSASDTRQVDRDIRENYPTRHTPMYGVKGGKTKTEDEQDDD